MKAVVIQVEALRTLTRRILVASGSDSGEAEIVADHLIDANLSGHDSHGVGLLPMYAKDRVDGFLKPNGHARLVREDGAIGVFDGGMAYGHVAAREASAWGIARARTSGVAIVGLRNSYHIARVGTYGEMAAAAGLVSIMFVNVVAGTQGVAAFGGADGRLHTNPICMAIPAGRRDAWMLDMATTTVAAREAMAGCRWHQRQPRSAPVIARAWIGSPLRKRLSSSASSCAEA